MSEFLKLAYDLLSKVVYNLVQWVVNFATGFVTLFITGWKDYIAIFNSYAPHLSWIAVVLGVLLLIILGSIPLGALALLVRRIILKARLKAANEDSTVLYKEIGRLNKQVLELNDEKQRILSLQAGRYTGVSYDMPYAGAPAGMQGAAAVPDPLGAPVQGSAVAVGNISGANIGEDALSAATAAAINAVTTARRENEEREKNSVNRFPKLSMVDMKYAEYETPDFDKTVTLQRFTEGFRLFASSQMKLYYSPEIVRRFVAGISAGRLLILEGISGTGKTSLPYSFSRYVGNPATMVSVQPSYRDRTELVGYFNEFSKQFKETEFLRALYEGGYREDPSFIVLDEMNLARIEYYFAEMLSVLELPDKAEWMLDLVPTAWPGDPMKLEGGKIRVPDTVWYIGTANNDDSTFTITDKVYDRAIPIEINERAAPFECELEPCCNVTCAHLEAMFERARIEHPISEQTVANMLRLDGYLQTRFKLAFGNRIMKQMYDFVPVYVACGGTELGGLDYIIARKVLKKFESLNVGFVRDEIKGLIAYIEKTFGSENMPDSRSYLERIQNLY